MIEITKYIYSGAIRDYLESDLEQSISSDRRFYGKGAELLGLDEYCAQVFDDLLRNRLPDTEQKWTVRDCLNRRAGWDLTFNWPKSVSVHIAATGDSDVQRMTREVCHETMQTLESLVETRVRRGRGDDGNQTYCNRQTGNCVWVPFTHILSRPVNGLCSPHFHAHCFVANGTFDFEEDRWKALEPGAMYQAAGALQRITTDRLAGKLREGGYQLRAASWGKRPGWELAHIAQSDLRAFSPRAELIKGKAQSRREQLAAAAELLCQTKGMSYECAMAQTLGELGVRTREWKTKQLPKEEQTALWRQQMSAAKWDALSVESAKKTAGLRNHYLKGPDGLWRIATPMEISDYYESRHPSRETGSPSSPAARRWVQSYAKGREPVTWQR